MKRYWRSAVAMTAIVCLVGAVAPVGGIAFPPSVAVDGRTLVLNGAGLRVFFLMVDGYASALYLPAPAHDLDAVLAEPGPKAVRTVFLHAASASQLRDELGRIHDGYCRRVSCDAADENAYRTLRDHETPVRPGDSETLLVAADGVTVSRNGTVIVRLADAHFGNALLGSMLGPSAPTSGYRSGMLGLAD